MRTLMVFLQALPFLLPAALAGQVSEYEAKAALLQKLGQFVTWPESAFPSPDEPFTIGVLGDDPFGDTLEKVLKGKTVRGRALRFKRSRDPAALRGCQIVFIARSEEKRLGKVREALKGLPILTVGEMDAPPGRGAVMNITLTDSRLRFSIDLGIAEQANILIDPRLLKLAWKVYR